MPGAKEIRTKIKSIQNTQKITKAMEMVAASKMRRAQDRMQAARPYAEKMRQVIWHVGHSHAEYRHPFLVERAPRRVGFIVVSTDRGLCGGLNINLFKQTLSAVKEWTSRRVEVDLVLFGAKAAGFFRRIGANVVAQSTHLGDVPRVEDVIGSVRVLLDAYAEERIDRVFLAYNDFVNTMTQRPHIEQLVPVAPPPDEPLRHHWDYIYEPDAREVLDRLLSRYIESLTYQGLVENRASEQAARMVAMKSASDNAGNLIDELQLVYNKARQAAITREISEIVGGAAAV